MNDEEQGTTTDGAEQLSGPDAGPEAASEPETRAQAPADAEPEASAERSAATGARRRLAPVAVDVERMIGRITVASIFSPLLVVLVTVTLLAELSGPVPVILFTVWALAVVSMVAFFQIWPGLHHRNIWYQVDAGGITIRRGVVWRKITSVPRARVQHTDVSQGPIQRRFDLATLVMHTAGTQDASVSLSGLEHDVALRIRDFLIEERGKDVEQRGEDIEERGEMGV